MLRFFLILIAVVAAYFAYDYYYNDAHGPVTRLKSSAPGWSARIFSGDLNAGDLPTAEITQMRAELTAQKAKDTKNARTYQTAIALCDTLLTGIAEKTKAADRLADQQAKGYDTLLSRRSRKAADRQVKKEFYENAIETSWMQKCNALKQSSAAQLAQLAQS